MTRATIAVLPDECECCHLVDTTVYVLGRPRCALCREFCQHTFPCNVRYWLESGPSGRDTLQANLRRALREDKPHA